MAAKKWFSNLNRGVKVIKGNDAGKRWKGILGRGNKKYKDHLRSECTLQVLLQEKARDSCEENGKIIVCECLDRKDVRLCLYPSKPHYVR